MTAIGSTTPYPDPGSAAGRHSRRRFHLVLAGPGTDPRLRWIAAHCQHVGRSAAGLRNYYCVPADIG